jgi:hypothetical protein
MEDQFLFEKDKNKKLSNKAEEYKRKFIQQRLILQQQDETINTSLRPGPRGSPGEAELREEIFLLRRELLNSRKSSSELVSIIRETLVNTIGTVSIDVEDSRSAKIKVDMSRWVQIYKILLEFFIYLIACGTEYVTR